MHKRATPGRLVPRTRAMRFAGHPRKRLFGCLLALTAACALFPDSGWSAEAAGVIGDHGLTPLTDDLIQRYYPRQDAWGKAGVTGGLRKDRPVVAKAKPGDDLQALIEKAEAGVIALAAGRYELSAPLRLKNGVVLRGASDGKTELVHQKPNAVLMKELTGAGLEHLTFTFADPGLLHKQEHLARGVYANAKDHAPGAEATVMVSACTDCWLDGVRIHRSLDHPASISGRHLTIRNLTVRDALNRGVGSGQLIFHNAEGLLVYGLCATGLRWVSLKGPLTGCVFRSSALGAAIRFTNADGIHTNLFEDSDFIFPPLYPWRPFAKDTTLLGPDNLLINARCYAQGTDAIQPKLLIEPGDPYRFQPRFTRGNYDSVTRVYDRSSLLVRCRVRANKATSKDGSNGEKALEPLPTIPEGTLLSPLGHKDRVDRFLIAAPFDGAIKVEDVAGTLKMPAAAGQSLSLGGQKLAFARLDDTCKSFPGSPDPTSVVKKEGMFGIRIRPTKGATINLLKALGGWKKSGVMQTVFRIRDSITLKYSLYAPGAKLRSFLGTHELRKGATVRLKEGYYPFTVIVQTYRRAPFEKKSLLRASFEVVASKERRVEWVDTPKPAQASLFPYKIEREPDYVLRERAASDAFFALYKKYAYNAPYTSLPADLRKLAASHPDCVAAHAARVMVKVIEGAPHQEGEKLDRRAWSVLADHYRFAGMPERNWAIGKAKLGGKIRRFYDKEGNLIK